jgi:hypothetical protein
VLAIVFIGVHLAIIHTRGFETPAPTFMHMGDSREYNYKNSKRKETCIDRDATHVKIRPKRLSAGDDREVVRYTQLVYRMNPRPPSSRLISGYLDYDGLPLATTGACCTSYRPYGRYAAKILQPSSKACDRASSPSTLK